MAVTTAQTRIYLNPYTGRVLATRQGLMPSVWMRQLHKNLLAGKTGGWIVVSATVTLLFQAVSGLYLWWPLKRIAIKMDGSMRRMAFDTHHAAGFFSSLFIVAICLTGLARHYPEITDRLFARAPATAPVAGTGIGHAISIDEAAALARRTRLSLDDPASEAAGSGATAPADPLARFGLTEREREILVLLAGGRSNPQIAESLFISPKTASVHVSNILAKLGVDSRVEAAAVAHRLGVTG